MHRPANGLTTGQAQAARAPGLPAHASGNPGMQTLRPTTVAAAVGPAAAQLQILMARVDALEAQVRQLQAGTVQQWPDGRLHLPAGNKLQVDIGNTRLSMDVASFTVEANGQVLLGSRPGWQPPAPTPPATGVQGLAAQAGSGGSWQSQAAANGTENPRHLGAGTILNTKP
jgi:hypothetical protein